MSTTRDRRVLLVGWFSFEGMGATAGDLMAADVVSRWLTVSGCAFDIAYAAPFEGGVDWRTADPRAYSDVVFACGPLGNGHPVDALLQRYRTARLAAVDVSMLQHLDEWNPFQLLLERDSSRTARPDLAFLAPESLALVVGVILVHPQSEYGNAGRHEFVDSIITRHLIAREAARVDIDTRLDVPNPVGKTAATIEAAVGRMDGVITTRLHGMVLSLRRGIAPVVIDPIAGGAKVTRQGRAIGWPVLDSGELDESALSAAFDWSLTSDARNQAKACLRQARRALEPAAIQFSDFFAACRDSDPR